MDVLSLVFLLLPVAERKGLSAGSKAQTSLPFCLAIPTVPFSHKPHHDALHAQDESGKSSDMAIN